MSSSDDFSEDRRDFLYYATAGAGVVVTGAAVWPLIDQMNPSADVAAASTMRVDVADLRPGAQLNVLFLGKPVFIRRRTEEEIRAAVETSLDDLPDQSARNVNIEDGAPATDLNRATLPFGMERAAEADGEVEFARHEWLVQRGVCTHLGCIPLGEDGDYDGWFCPCHGSHYDTAGRIRRGPAPENLPIIHARFVDETTLLLGEET